MEVASVSTTSTKVCASSSASERASAAEDALPSLGPLVFLGLDSPAAVFAERLSGSLSLALSLSGSLTLSLSLMTEAAVLSLSRYIGLPMFEY